MATAVLSSRNSLNHQFDSRLPRHSSAATTNPRRLKRSSTAANTLVMGQVKILKRGETLSAFLNKEKNSCADRDENKRHRLRRSDVDLIVASTNRIGPEPETVQIGAFKRLEIISSVDFSGSCNSVPPPPTALPIPCFLEKKKK